MISLTHRFMLQTIDLAAHSKRHSRPHNCWRALYLAQVFSLSGGLTKCATGRSRWRCSPTSTRAVAVAGSGGLARHRRRVAAAGAAGARPQRPRGGARSVRA